MTPLRVHFFGFCPGLNVSSRSVIAQIFVAEVMWPVYMTLKATVCLQVDGGCRCPSLGKVKRERAVSEPLKGAVWGQLGRYALCRRLRIWSPIRAAKTLCCLCLVVSQLWLVHGVCDRACI
jgi:hypothetical protein